MFEHNCGECNYVTYNKYAMSPKVCPKCGQELAHICDEVEYAEFEQEFGED